MPVFSSECFKVFTCAWRYRTNFQLIFVYTSRKESNLFFDCGNLIVQNNLLKITLLSLPTLFVIFYAHTCVCVYIWMHAKLLQLCLTLFDPMDNSLPGSSVHGILQARILEWAAMPSFR